MRRIRICVQMDLSGTMLELPKARLHYLRKVLRLSDGDKLSVFDGENLEREATLSGSELTLHTTRPTMPPSPVQLTLVQGIARGDRMDTIIQKATELGINRIVPIFTERCEVKLAGDRLAKRLAHWRQIALSACEQCGRSQLPVVEPACGLRTAIGERAEDQTDAIVLSPQGDTPFSQQRLTHQRLWLAVGPEGGFDQAELSTLVEHGFSAATLGPRVLRTETAGPAAIAIAQACWGDLT